MNPPTTRRVEIRSVADEGRTIVLKPITPGVVDDYGTVWEPDVFDRSLEERMPVMCWGHDWVDPIGRAVDVAKDRDQTPLITFQFDDPDAVPRARQAIAQVRSGTITDCSVGFVRLEWRQPTSEECDALPGAREVMVRAGLDEVSLVVRGAVPGAKVLALRSGKRGKVDGDFVIDLARRVHAGELSADEAQVALGLVELPDIEELVDALDATDVDGTLADPGPDLDAELADLDAALDALGRSKRRGL